MFDEAYLRFRGEKQRTPLCCMRNTYFQLNPFSLNLYFVRIHRSKCSYAISIIPVRDFWRNNVLFFKSQRQIFMSIREQRDIKNCYRIFYFYNICFERTTFSSVHCCSKYILLLFAACASVQQLTFINIIPGKKLRYLCY